MIKIIASYDKAWLLKITGLTQSGRFAELDSELASASQEYLRLAQCLEKLTDRLRVSSENLQSDIEAMSALLEQVDEKGNVGELCDAIRGTEKIELVPEHRRRAVWAHGDMWFRSCDARAILERAKKVAARVVLDESILPDECPRDLDEVQIKFRNEIWEIHKNDPDPFPSDPHAHLGRSTKLDLRNGDLYNKASFLNQRIKRKDLEKIRSLFEDKGVAMPVLDYATSKMAS